MATFTTAFKSRLKAYFIHRLGAFDYRRGWMKCDCPICNKELKFGINISTNRTNCFVCGYSKPPLELIKEVEALDTYQGVYKLLESGNFEGFEFKEEKVELRSFNEGFQLPEGFKLLNQGSSQLARSARSYVKSRGFDIDKVSNKGWGYCSGNPEMFGYLIMPFFDNYKLVYYNARNFLSTGPRYNNPKIEETGIGKSSIWYNRDALYMYKQIYLTEGLINAETMGDKAIASGGKFISKYQLNEIIKSPVERVVIILDPDAKDKAYMLALSLVQFKMVKVIILPEGKDPNEYGRLRTMKLIYRTRYASYNELLKLKNNL